MGKSRFQIQRGKDSETGKGLKSDQQVLIQCELLSYTIVENSNFLGSGAQIIPQLQVQTAM